MFEVKQNTASKNYASSTLGFRLCVTATIIPAPYLQKCTWSSLYISTSLIHSGSAEEAGPVLAPSEFLKFWFQSVKKNNKQKKIFLV